MAEVLPGLSYTHLAKEYRCRLAFHGSCPKPARHAFRRNNDCLQGKKGHDLRGLVETQMCPNQISVGHSFCLKPLIYRWQAAVKPSEVMFRAQLYGVDRPRCEASSVIREIVDSRKWHYRGTTSVSYKSSTRSRVRKDPCERASRFASTRNVFMTMRRSSFDKP